MKAELYREWSIKRLMPGRWVAESQERGMSARFESRAQARKFVDQFEDARERAALPRER